MFAIEYSNDLEPDKCQTMEFQDKELFFKKFDSIQNKYKAIWLSETGVRIDNKKADWFYFWWSDPLKAAGWGERPQRGQGWACDGPQTFMVDYIPDFDGKLI